MLTSQALKIRQFRQEHLYVLIGPVWTAHAIAIAWVLYCKKEASIVMGDGVLFRF
jgi:hypothetical protein